MAERYEFEHVRLFREWSPVRPIDDVDRAKWAGQEKFMFPQRRMAPEEFFAASIPEDAPTHFAQFFSQNGSQGIYGYSEHENAIIKLTRDSLLNNLYALERTLVGDSIVAELGIGQGLHPCDLRDTHTDVWSTGGGCVAWGTRNPEAPGLYAMLTSDAVNLPEPGLPIEIGIYTEDGEQESFIEFATIELMDIWHEKYTGHYLPEDERFAVYCERVAWLLLHRRRNNLPID